MAYYVYRDGAAHWDALSPSQRFLLVHFESVALVFESRQTAGKLLIPVSHITNRLSARNSTP